MSDTSDIEGLKGPIRVDRVMSVHAVSEEHEEYLRLAEVFQGERLKKLTRKIDWRVLPQFIIIYLLSYVDRTNVANARLFSAEDDLGIDGTQWNLALSVFFITYAFGNVPSNLALKRFGPKKVLPFILLCVSFILIGAGCSNNFAQWITMRLLLGLFEAGIFPGCLFTIMTWYTPTQIHFRSTIFYSGASMAGAFSGLLAYAIGHLDGTWGYHGWRFVYVIEGVATTVVAIIAFFVLYETPAKVGPWLHDDERRFLVLRNKYEYGQKNAAGSDDSFNWKAARQSLKSWHVYVLSFAYFSIAVAVYGLSYTLPTIVLNMGFTAANAQLLSAPPYILACLCVMVSGWWSDKYRLRMWSMVIPSCIGLVGLLIAIFTTPHKRLVPPAYVGVCLATAGLYCLSPCVSVWIGLNQAGQTKRAMGVAVTLLFAQLGGLVGSNVFLEDEAPSYPTGFGTCLSFLGLGCIVTPLIYWYILGRINTRRDAISEEEVLATYTIAELQEMGDLSPLYRYER